MKSWLPLARRRKLRTRRRRRSGSVCLNSVSSVAWKLAPICWTRFRLWYKLAWVPVRSVVVLHGLDLWALSFPDVCCCRTMNFLSPQSGSAVCPCLKTVLVSSGLGESSNQQVYYSLNFDLVLWVVVCLERGWIMMMMICIEVCLSLLNSCVVVMMLILKHFQSLCLRRMEEKKKERSVVSGG